MFSLYRAHTVPLGVIFPQFYTMGTYHFSIRTTCLPSTLISLIEGVFTERQLCRRPSAGPWETASHSRPVPPAPSMEVTDFQGSGRVPYLLRGADSEEDIPAGERSASPQHGGCFLPQEVKLPVLLLSAYFLAAPRGLWELRSATRA